MSASAWRSGLSGRAVDASLRGCRHTRAAPGAIRRPCRAARFAAGRSADGGPATSATAAPEHVLPDIPWATRTARHAVRRGRGKGPLARSWCVSAPPTRRRAMPLIPRTSSRAAAGRHLRGDRPGRRAPSAGHLRIPSSHRAPSRHACRGPGGPCAVPLSLTSCFTSVAAIGSRCLAKRRFARCCGSTRRSSG